MHAPIVMQFVFFIHYLLGAMFLCVVASRKPEKNMPRNRLAYERRLSCQALFTCIIIGTIMINKPFDMFWEEQGTVETITSF